MPNETFYLSYGNGNTSYRVKITDFCDNIHKWKPCESVDLRQFYAHDDKSQFQLALYPNGSQEDEKGYVSIFLKNRGENPLHCDWKIKISWAKNLRESEEIVIKGENEFLLSEHDHTFSDLNCLKKGCKLIEHSVFKSWSFWEKNSMEIECTVSNIFVQSDENICRSSQKLANESSASQLASIETKISKIELQNEQTLTNLELKLNKILLKLEEKKNSRSIPVPECPVCFERLNNSVKIAQCVLGHLLCWNCKQRPELEACPSCKGPICGRAFGMENYLKTLFPTPGDFQFLAEKAGQGAVVNVDDESRIGG